MIAYASRTGTRRNLAALRAAGWRLLVSPTGVWRNEGFKYCLDNGAWTAHQQGTEWDAGLFRACLEQMGPRADFVVCPDIVEGGARSLARSLRWLPLCLDYCARALIAVQDGMHPESFRGVLSRFVGVFVGGSTAWKENTVCEWARVAREHGAWCHVGRVNTVRRISLCAFAGVDSIDGTSASRFSKTLTKLDHARRQPALWSAA